MGVYIRGMAMPETCKRCDFETDELLCDLTGDCTDNVRNNERLEGCPLTEIKTPHGDLIDSDKLLKATVLNPVHVPYITIRDVKGMTAVIEAERR